MSNACHREYDTEGYILPCHELHLKRDIDAASGGAFRRKNAEEATHLIELANINYRAPSEASRSNSRLRGGGMIELNKMSAIETKLDVIMNRLNN